MKSARDIDSADPSRLMIDARRLVRMAGGTQGLLLGLVVLISVASRLNASASIAVFALVYVLAPVWVRRWRASRELPDIRAGRVVSEGSWWRWQGSHDSVWRIHPVTGLVIIAATLGTKLLSEHLSEVPRGIGGDWLVLAIALNYLLIYRKLSLIEDLVMGVGLGLPALVVMVRPTPHPEHIEEMRFWSWGIIGLLMVITGTMRHLRWRRWIAAHRREAP